MLINRESRYCSTMRLLLVIFLSSTAVTVKSLPESRYDPPKLVKRELPPPPFKVNLIKRDLVPGQRSLTVTPSNTHAMIGGTVILECEGHAAPPVTRVLWYEFATTGVGQVISDNGNVLPSHPNSARYRIIQAQAHHFHLEISDIRWTDGGAYACADIQSGPPQVYSGQCELVVLASDPICTTLVPPTGTVLEGQNFTKSCVIDFRGNMNPTMHWTGPEPYQKADIVTNNQTFSGIAFTVDRGMDARSYHTLTNFTAPATSPPGIANNPPSYSYSHQYGQLFVYWSPKNMFAVPMKPEYMVGENITCYADAFPLPFYSWQNLDSLDVIQEQFFTITPNMVGRNATLRCRAQNVIQGFLYEQNHFINVYVPAPTTPTTPTTTPTTTTPLPEGHCSDLTGWWQSNEPYAEIYLIVRDDQSGQVAGYMRNGTDQVWVEIFGRARISDYNFVGLTAIWPYDVGVTGMAGECHRCFGEEVLMTAGIWRAYADSAFCGQGGTPTPHTAFKFSRITVGRPEPGATPWERPGFKVFRPTPLVTGALGLDHLLD